MSRSNHNPLNLLNRPYNLDHKIQIFTTVLTTFLIPIIPLMSKISPQATQLLPKKGNLMIGKNLTVIKKATKSNLTEIFS